MHLSSLTLRGFKSFPDRTRLVFSPGVSVIVGPNGSGKSNVTDAVLWALGEQSPLAVRGQTMQDVIFAGARGLAAREAAEVEVVLDNSDGELEVPFSELSIVRRLDRSGEGEYRMNGARCRLADVLEALSDTGLGKEMHSVVSQGRVEAIINSRPLDRRLLIEEAAGLGKHRKRRRRAQLKLERTQDNLARALDVEREARSRLKPLKRQAEAADLHERLERQRLDALLELAVERLRRAGEEASRAEEAAAAARAELDEHERELAGVTARRRAAEEALAAHHAAREALGRLVYGARSASERIGVRLERARATASAAADDARRRREELARIEEEMAAPQDGGRADRIRELDAELERLEADREDLLRAELAALEKERSEAERAVAEHDAAVAAAASARDRAEQAADAARTSRRGAERAWEASRAATAATGGELASANQFLRRITSAAGGRRSLAADLAAEPGFEQALAAVLGATLRAAVVADASDAAGVLDAAGADGAIALLRAGGGAASAEEAEPPAPGAEPLRAHVRPSDDVAAIADRLLADTWVVDHLDDLRVGFTGTAVTRAGRVLVARLGELRQAPARGDEEALERRNRRDELVVLSETRAREEAAARAEVERLATEVDRADEAREGADAALRAVRRDHDEHRERVRGATDALRRRRAAPDEGPGALRRAELRAELRVERALAEEASRARAGAERRRSGLAARIARDEALVVGAGRAAGALALAADAVAARRERLERELAAGDARGGVATGELRDCADEEARLRARGRGKTEDVTRAEVARQRARDESEEAAAELRALAERLGREPGAAATPLADDRRRELEQRVDRLARRREALGPVNPLAQVEYEEASSRVEELEAQRIDLETTLAELKGLIRDTDRRIREQFEETFDTAARNFEDVVAHLFPGGRGRLRLVQADGLHAVEPAASAADGEGEPADGEERAEAEELPPAQEPGVEVEVTPAGKASKRLSLLSGGEKSLVALAFLFAVFLARPCPFYILDEVEAALDDVNIDRFLQLLRRFSGRAQFIVVTHQKRTMDAADCLYGVSMGGDGVSRVVSRRLSRGVELAEAGEGRRVA